MSEVYFTKFAIVTVVLNDLPGLLRTRASLEEQSFNEWQHIILDGLSSDGTEFFGAKVNSDPKTKFFSENDNGIYDAMQKGWRYAEADAFVIFLNAGDVFTSSNALMTAKNRIDASPKSMRWACTTHEEIMPDGSNWICKLVSEPSLENQLYAYGYRSHQGVVMKREFIESLGGFDQHLKIASDWDLIVRAMQVEYPAVWQEPLIRFEIGGFSSQRILEAHLELRSLREKYLWKTSRDKFFDDLYCAIFFRSIGYENYLTKVYSVLKCLKFWANFGTLLNILSDRFFGARERIVEESKWLSMKFRRLINLFIGFVNLPRHLFAFLTYRMIGKLRGRLSIKPLAKP